MTPSVLSLATGCSIGLAQKWAKILTDTMRRYHIDTAQRQAFFLAQVSHESSRMSVVVENLNYSANGLLSVFGKYFTPELAEEYARKPYLIASRVYANSMGNGPESSGDGWLYRGKGLIQITGKTNHVLCGMALDVDLLHFPDILLEPEYSALSAGWFWSNRGLNAIADSGDFELLTRRINGGLNGIEDRLVLLGKAKAALMS